MSEEWGQWTVSFGDDAVFSVNIEDRLELSKDVWVELELFYRSALFS